MKEVPEAMLNAKVLNSIVLAVLPMVVTLTLGYFAAKWNFFDNKSTKVLNNLVMKFALPLTIFFSLSQVNRTFIFKNLVTGAWLLSGMLIWYFVVFFINRKILHTSLSLSALRSLTMSTPAGLFFGPAILPPLFPDQSAITIAICGICMNLFMLPLTVGINAAGQNKEGTHSTSHSLVVAFRNPLVWSPILAVLLVLLGIKIPAMFGPLFTELGQSASGTAIFSIGITLFIYHISFKPAVLVNTFVKVLLVPASMWVVMTLFGQPAALVNIITVTMMIGPLVFPTILAEQNNEGQQEMASSLCLSVICFVLVLLGYVVITGI